MPRPSFALYIHTHRIDYFFPLAISSAAALLDISKDSCAIRISHLIFHSQIGPRRFRLSAHSASNRSAEAAMKVSTQLRLLFYILGEKSRMEMKRRQKKKDG